MLERPGLRASTDPGGTQQPSCCATGGRSSCAPNLKTGGTAPTVKIQTQCRWQDAEDVVGNAGDCPARFAWYLRCLLKVGQRGIRSPSQGQGGRGCFGVQVFGPACVQVMQATLRRSTWGNKTRQRYTLRVGLPSLFRAQLD